MKYFLLLLLVVGLVASVDAQVVSGSHGQRFNESDPIYYKSGFTASTANDTTGFVSIAGASDIRFWGTADDSTRVVVYWQGRNSTTGAVSSWTLGDTVGTDGVGSAPTAGGPSTSEMSGGTAALSALLGYDEVRTYVDYITGCTDGGDGTAAIFRLYVFRFASLR